MRSFITVRRWVCFSRLPVRGLPDMPSVPSGNGGTARVTRLHNATAKHGAYSVVGAPRAC